MPILLQETTDDLLQENGDHIVITRDHDLSLSDGLKAGDQSKGSLTLDFVLSEGLKSADSNIATQQGLLYVPPSIYTIEVRDSSGQLLGVLKNAYKIELTETLNAPKQLTFFSPADESKLSSITRAAELWVRDVKNNVVLAKTRLERRDDTR